MKPDILLVIPWSYHTISFVIGNNALERGQFFSKYLTSYERQMALIDNFEWNLDRQMMIRMVV